MRLGTIYIINSLIWRVHQVRFRDRKNTSTHAKGGRENNAGSCKHFLNTMAAALLLPPLLRLKIIGNAPQAMAIQETDTTRADNSLDFFTRHMPARKHARSDAHSPDGGGGPIVYRGWIVPRGMAEASVRCGAEVALNLCGCGGGGQRTKPHEIDIHLEPSGTPHVSINYKTTTADHRPLLLLLLLLLLC